MSLYCIASEEDTSNQEDEADCGINPHNVISSRYASTEAQLYMHIIPTSSIYNIDIYRYIQESHDNRGKLCLSLPHGYSQSNHAGVVIGRVDSYARGQCIIFTHTHVYKRPVKMDKGYERSHSHVTLCQYWDRNTYVCCKCDSL